MKNNITQGDVGKVFRVCSVFGNILHGYEKIVGIQDAHYRYIPLGSEIQARIYASPRTWHNIYFEEISRLEAVIRFGRRAVNE